MGCCPSPISQGKAAVPVPPEVPSPRGWGAAGFPAASSEGDPIFSAGRELGIDTQTCWLHWEWQQAQVPAHLLPTWGWGWGATLLKIHPNPILSTCPCYFYSNIFPHWGLCPGGSPAGVHCPGHRTVPCPDANCRLSSWGGVPSLTSQGQVCPHHVTPFYLHPGALF